MESHASVADCTHRKVVLPNRLRGFVAAQPEEVSMDSAPLEAFREAMHHNVEKLGSLAGCAHVVLRNGKCVLAAAQGVSDRESGERFGLDTLCPLHGASKPLVVAAFLTLVDEGSVKLSDPISKHMEFPNERVVNGKMQEVKRLPTFRDLLAMTAGVGYDGSEPYKGTMRKIKAGKVASLPEMCDALVESPLLSEPGSEYAYSFSTDLVGRACEYISGLRIDRFVRERLLKPLGMSDTYFSQTVPAAKRRRLAALYKITPGCRGFRFKRFETKLCAPGIMSPGGGILSYKDVGMVSSVRDYARFCHMLLHDGVGSDGRRILKRQTVRALWRDGLAPYQNRRGRLKGWNDAGTDFDLMSWSLLNAHLNHDRKSDGKGARAGHTMWMGGGGGAVWNLDRKRRLATLSFAPCLMGREGETDGLGPMADDATPAAIAAVDNFLERRKKRRRLG
eukprot:TRINITY_DN5983_c0_g5_i1.p1 TRINITY_DN5983_c0_g5~~TRINITY_DN5983_c0_g5_i1.p1  ORF type:complete len:464 (+),score=74.33 TRINITY_DN5983_c0_g5_i1:48-1394(+)